MSSRGMKARMCLAAAPLALLAGCGGGGGGGVGSTPTPTTTTPTTTTPTVTPTVVTPTVTNPTVAIPAANYDDAEYRRSNGATDIGAVTAYNAGSNGTGVTIAVVDTGIATVGSEFSGRLSTASRAFGGNTSVTDVDGHGTAISAIAAAARNGSDVQGIAWGATVLALRADTTGTCGTTDGCKFGDSSLASAIDYARTNGAKVINLSLGGSAANGMLTTAIQRATAAGIIVVVAAGNDGNASPDAFAQVAAAQGTSGLVIIAGSHDATGAISSFSDRAGTFGQFYLTALGERVRAFNQNGEAYLYSGTSFSTPGIAAAVALIEQAFPSLTAAQVVDILYKSATDAGAAGTDDVYGRGLLNLAKAFQPIGTASLAGSAVPVSSTDTTVLSPAMGDSSLTPSSLGSAIILDSYGRAFEMGLSGRTIRTGAGRPLRDGLRTDLLTQNTDLGAVSVATTVARRFADEPWTGFAQRGLAGNEQRIRPSSGAIVSRFSPGFATGMAFGEGAASLASRLDPSAGEGSFLSARSPATATDMARRPQFALAVRRSDGGIDFHMEAEQGRMARALPTDTLEPSYAQMRVGLGRRVGRLLMNGYLGTLREAHSLLGARLAPALGAGGATTRFIDMDAKLDLGRGWSANGGVRRSWTEGTEGGVLASADLRSMAASLGLVREGATNRIGLRLALPTRVTGGGLGLIVPTSYDYTTGAIGYETRFIGLAPKGRESDVEANAGLRLGEGWLETNLFWRRQPGNIAAAPDDLGAGLRYNLGF
ncbi:S8 family peptidase [Sphingomonas sp. BIUV-7]|uniref:S8 family peptidase n=1 Tax=Sphingomonas natans TaxID=3063330 RepID=A0ABT8YFK9_9SPHN|nr:S8 family peptidase [Sphingomonas sp. BIUV-7]MDO6416668.1 S8 family peptidase [Sphingomonas sp. BIUV-7]